MRTPQTTTRTASSSRGRSQTSYVETAAVVVRNGTAYAYNSTRGMHGQPQHVNEPTPARSVKNTRSATTASRGEPRYAKSRFNEPRVCQGIEEQRRMSHMLHNGMSVQQHVNQPQQTKVTTMIPFRPFVFRAPLHQPQNAVDVVVMRSRYHLHIARGAGTGFIRWSFTSVRIRFGYHTALMRQH